MVAEVMLSPGANMSRHMPKLELPHLTSADVLAPTVSARCTGDEGASDLVWQRAGVLAPIHRRGPRDVRCG